MAALIVILVLLVIAGAITASRSIKIVQQFEQGIVFRFGRIEAKPRGPGIAVIWPVGDRMQKVNMQIVAMAVPAQEGITRELRRSIDEPTEGPWGIRVERVEIKDVSLPEGMKRSMSRQAEAERERRARIITADGEYQASKRLPAGAHVMSRGPAARPLRPLPAGGRGG